MVTAPRAVFWGALTLALTLLATPVNAGRLSASDTTTYQAAFLAADAEQWPSALSLAAGAKDRTLADVLLWRAMQRPDSGYGFEAIAAFITAHPSWPGQDLLQRRAEEALTGAEPPRRLLDWFAANPPQTGHGKLLLALAQRASGKAEDARRTAREAWLTEAFSRDDEDRLMAAFGSTFTPDDHLRRTDRLLWDDHTVSAERMLTRVDSDHRHLFAARMALMANGPTMNKLIAAVPARLQNDPGLLYERMHWRRRKGLYDSAAELLVHANANKGDPDKWWQDRAVIARDYLNRGMISKAYETASKHGMKDGGGFAEAEWLAGWIALRFLNDPQAALPHFEAMYHSVATPISLGRGAYWAGRAAEALRRTEDSRRWYTTAAAQITTYYGQLAAARLGSSYHVEMPVAPQPTDADRAAFASNGLGKVVRALADIDRIEDSRPFLYRLNEDAPTPGQNRLAADLAVEIGRLDLAVSLSRRAALKGIHLVDTAYPVPRLDMPNAPESALLLSLIRQESNFNAAATSRVGARGLMQLMPATAKQVAKTEGLPHSTNALTENPSHNVTLGAAYLDELLDRFRGSYPLAIAGYNAGPGRPARWVKDYGDPRSGEIDPIDWVELIPFNETRNYVQRVMESLLIYRHRLGRGDLALTLEKELKR